MLRRLAAHKYLALSDVYRTPRAASRALIVAVCAALVLSLGFAYLVLFRTTLPVVLFRASDGAVRVTHLAYAIDIAVLALLMFKLGGLRARDVGLRVDNLLPAVLGAAAVWLAVQIMMGGAAVISGHGLELDQRWVRQPASVLFGAFSVQVFGTALAEELAFRGFLTPQVYLQLDEVKPRPYINLAIALVAVQLLFALSHLPQRLQHNVTGVELIANLGFTWAIGIGFALIYFRTGNLFLVVGVHALGNELMPLFASPMHQAVAFNLAVLALIVVWPVPQRE